MPKKEPSEKKKYDREGYRMKNVLKRITFYPEKWEELSKYKEKNYPRLTEQAFFEEIIEKQTGIKLD